MTTRNSKAKQPTTIQRTSTHIIGLDIGYGHTKAVGNGGSIIFPSVAGLAIDITFNADKLSRENPGDMITDNEGDWFVGALALKQIPQAQRIMLKGRTANDDDFGMDFRIRMMKAALAKLIPHQNRDVVHVRLSTGLPVDHMRDAALLKEAFIAQHLIQTNNSEFIANVVDVAVMPQPYGTLYGQQLQADGQLNSYYTALRSAVLDVGQFTVDAALDDNGDYINAESGSLEGGVHIVHDRIAAFLNADLRQPASHAQVEQVLRTGYLQVAGDAPTDYRAERETAVKGLLNGTIGLMNNLWKNGMDIDVIFIAGGGAELVADAVRKSYRQARVVANAQMSNAIGYRSYALHVAE